MRGLTDAVVRARWGEQGSRRSYEVGVAVMGGCQRLLTSRAKKRPALLLGTFSVPSSVNTGIMGGTVCISRKAAARP